MNMAAPSARTTPAVWRRVTVGDTPGAHGQLPVTTTKLNVRLNWMEVGGTERDADGVLSEPVTRIVAFSDYSDAVRETDKIIAYGRTYDVVAVGRLKGNKGWRLELRYNASI